jgi:hypothetical protein
MCEGKVRGEDIWVGEKGHGQDLVLNISYNIRRGLIKIHAFECHQHGVHGQALYLVNNTGTTDTNFSKTFERLEEG